LILHFHDRILCVSLSLIVMLSFTFVSLALFSLFFKQSFLNTLIFVEVSLLLVILIILFFYLPPFIVLPLLGLGASESSTGLSLSVHHSRGSSVTEWSV